MCREERLEGQSACPVTMEPTTGMVGIQWCRCQSWGAKFPVGKWHVLSSLVLWRVSGPFLLCLFVSTSHQIPSQFHFHLRNCRWFLLFIIRTLTSIKYFGFRIQKSSEKNWALGNPCEKDLGIFFKRLKKYLILCFLAELGLHCCTPASYSERGLLFVAICRFLIEVAPPVAEHRL